MPEYETQDLEYDSIDLGQMSGQFNLPPPRQKESLRAFITRTEDEQSYSKDEMRRLRVKKSAEREKL